MDLTLAYQHCRQITRAHYENFPVASVLLPAKIRHHVYPIYAFARHADDLADEYADRQALLEWRTQLNNMTVEPPQNPIFIALADTVKTFDLPLELFNDLISAFLQDLDKNRYEDMADLLNYCKRSANPVGRIILYLNGYRNEALHCHSDDICSALQLANFWQDVSIDLMKGRIYIPRDILEKHQLSFAEIQAGRFSDRFRTLMQELLTSTRQMFNRGLPLLDQLNFRLKMELTFTVQGGLAILDQIEEKDFNVLTSRPKLKKTDWMKIALKTLIPNWKNHGPESY